MKVICAKCNTKMKRVKVKVSPEKYERFVEVFRCPKCGLEVVVDWSDIGYEMLEQEEKLMG